MALSMKTFVSGGNEAGISSTKLRAEQMKSEFGFTTLAGDLFALSKQVEDIIGDANWKADVSGLDVQLVDLAAHIDADKSATEMEIKNDLLVTGEQHFVGAAQFDSTLAVTGKADFAGIVDVATTLSASEIKIDGDAAAAGNLYLVGDAGEITDSADLSYDGATFTVATNVQVNDSVQIDAELDVAGTASFAFANVLDLTPGRVVYVGSRAGVDGALVDSEHMTYAAGVLSVSGSTYGFNASIGGDLTVAGNFVVEGSTVTQNVGTVTTQDSLITLNKDGVSIPAAGAGIEFENGGSIVGYVKTNGSGDLLMKAATGGELTLDVDGTYEIAVNGNLTVEAASIVNQDLTTDATPEFTSVELSGLTASRLAATNGSNVLESINLVDWSAGDSNISVVSDGVGGIEIGLDLAVEIDSIKLADESANAGKALKVGADGLVTAAAWDEFVMVAPDLGLSVAQDGFKAKIVQSQDLRESASPTFAALNIGTVGDLSYNAGDLKIASTGKFLSADGAFAGAAGGTWASGLALSKDAASWDSLWTSYSMGSKGQLSLVEMLTAAAPSNNRRLVAVKSMQSNSSDVFIAAGDAGGAFPTGADKYTGGLSDVYVNGQKQVEGASADFEFATVAAPGTEKVKIAFKYQLQAGDVVELVRYPSAAK